MQILGFNKNNFGDSREDLWLLVTRIDLNVCIVVKCVFVWIMSQQKNFFDKCAHRSSFNVIRWRANERDSKKKWEEPYGLTIDLNLNNLAIFHTNLDRKNTQKLWWPSICHFLRHSFLDFGYRRSFGHTWKFMIRFLS